MVAGTHPNVSTGRLSERCKGLYIRGLVHDAGNGNTIAWLTPHAATVSIDRNGILLNRAYSASFFLSLSMKEIVAWAPPEASAAGDC
jgi:hypothetical protein